MIKRKIRHKRIRAKIFGTANRPRLNVFRSNKRIYCQLINDEAGRVLVSASDFELKDKIAGKTNKAKEIGRLLAQKALKMPIKKAIFDRGGYKYHGRVKALADGAREGGLKF